MGISASFVPSMMTMICVHCMHVCMNRTNTYARSIKTNVIKQTPLELETYVPVRSVQCLELRPLPVRRVTLLQHRGTARAQVSDRILARSVLGVEEDLTQEKGRKEEGRRTDVYTYISIAGPTLMVPRMI